MALPLLYKRIDTTHAQAQRDGTGSEDLSSTVQIPHNEWVERYTKSLTIGYPPDSLYPSLGFGLGSSIGLPNLKTLQIQLPPRGDNLQPLHPSHVSHYPPNVPPVPSISLLREQLRPKTLVIRNVSTRLINLHLPSIPIEVYENVESLMLISSSYEKYQPATLPLDLPIIPKLKKVYWFFDPTFPERREVAIHKEWYKVNVWGITQLILALQPSVRVSIVNVGSTILKDPNHRCMSVENRQREIERQLWDEVRMKSGEEPYSWNLDDLEERMGTVRFFGLEVFVGDEEWWDWFDVGEMRNWNTAMGNFLNRKVEENRRVAR
ncbi:hypothetical protein I302_100422 [Kwoniella bestiolae CBS 10118]|uniref:Uncharacterized protein n=1 Tax=Kwoniella bestiolae CBS 10118 TaxID=1296100 RepID=A0A1B9G535_9TREE|nr:hypothetical protein I302_03798 [Kwoniella bestiolae CBS 10118]OCF26121.1 hypothetical protein I302_03798 [Kwoniella bestiolae CBS 10118]